MRNAFIKKNRRSRNDIIFDIINTSVLFIALLLVLYPLYYIVIASVSSPTAVNTGSVVFGQRILRLKDTKKCLHMSLCGMHMATRSNMWWLVPASIFYLQLQVRMHYRVKRFMAERQSCFSSLSP